MGGHSVNRGCNIPDCPDPHLALGLCRRHYQAARMNRPPMPKRRPAPVTPRSGPSYIRGGKGV